MSIAEAQALLERAATAGVVVGTDHGTCRLTERGRLLLDKGLPRRMRPDEVRAACDAAIVAARKWNTEPDRAVILTAIRLYGSALEDRTDYGDVNLDIEITEAPISEAAVARLLPAVSRRIRLYHPRAATPRHLVAHHQARLLRNRITRAAPGITLCPGYSAGHLGLPWRDLFKVGEDGCEVTPDDTLHPGDPEARERALEHWSEFPDLRGSREAIDIPPLEMPEDSHAPNPGPDRLVSSEDLARHADRHWRGPVVHQQTNWPGDFDFLGLAKTQGLMSHIEACQAWSVPTGTPGAQLRDILALARRRGVIGSGKILLNFFRGEVSLTLPAVKRPQDGPQGRQPVFHAAIVGRKRAITLTPEDRPTPSALEKTTRSIAARAGPASLKPDYISLARTLAPVLFDLLAALKIPAGANPILRLELPQDAAPDLPSLRPICTRIGRLARGLQLNEGEIAQAETLFAQPGGLDYHCWVEHHIEVLLLPPGAPEDIRDSGDLSDCSAPADAGGGLTFQARSRAEAFLGLNNPFDLAGKATPDEIAAELGVVTPKLGGLGQNWALLLTRHTKFPINTRHSDPAAVRQALAVAKLIPA